jgi:phosphoserine phosphatase
MNETPLINWETPYKTWVLTVVLADPDLNWQPHQDATKRWEVVRPENVPVLVEGLNYFMPLTIQAVTPLSRANAENTHTAWDFTLALEDHCPFFGMHALVKDALDGFKLDWCIHPLDDAFPRRKALLMSDMDSTFLEGECIDELADFVGKKAEVARITEAAMNGTLNFEDALIERVALLKGLPVASVHHVLNATPRMAGAKTLVDTMRHLGCFNVLVSGGFTPFTQALCDELRLDAHQANQLEEADGVFTGQVIPPILGKEAKLDALHYYSKRLSIPLEATLTVGDGANDLLMLQASGLGVAFHAKKAVHEQSHTSVRFNDLSALLYFQGIPQSDWTI